MAGESAVLSIPWDDPKANNDEINIYQHQGERIDLDTSAEADEAYKAAQRIYADAGHTMDEGDLRQLRSRILGGQSMAELVANTYDEAKRRFQTEDTPQSRAEEAAGLRPTYDSQLNQGRSFDPPAVMMEQLVTGAREVADLQDAWPATSHQMAPPGNTHRTNFGPAGSAIGGDVYVDDAAGGSALPWGLILIGGAVLVGGYLLLRKKK